MGPRKSLYLFIHKLRMNAAKCYPLTKHVFIVPRVPKRAQSPHLAAVQEMLQ